MQPAQQQVADVAEEASGTKRDTLIDLSAARLGKLHRPCPDFSVGTSEDVAQVRHDLPHGRRGEERRASSIGHRASSIEIGKSDLGTVDC